MVQRDASQPIELSIIKKKSAAKHLSHVILIIQNSNSITDEWLKDSFKQFWRIWVLNAVILFWRHDKLQIYRYNPFIHQFLIKLNTTSDLPKIIDLFPKRIPNMHGKPLRICLYADEVRAIFYGNNQISGGDGIMSQYVAERLNATRVVNHVSAFGNRSADVCFQEIAHELDDMALNIRFLSAPSFRMRVENTIVHSRDDLCVLLSKAKTASIFWNLFRSFNIIVWVAVAMSVPLAYGFCGLIFRNLCYTERLLLQLFASTLAMPLTRVPSKFSLRLFLFSWLTYGLLISGAFKGNLTTNLVFRTYLPDINTMKDLAESPYDLMMFSRHKKHLNRFLNTEDRFERMVKQKMTIVPDDVLLQHINSNNLSYAYLRKYHLAIFQVNARRHSRYGRPLYHVMSTCLVPFHAVYIVPYGSPYLGFLNSLIRSSQEFGFNLYWERMVAESLMKSSKSIIRSQKNDDDPVVLRLAHFQAAFCLWAIGIFCGLLVFLFEIREIPSLKAIFVIKLLIKNKK